MKTTNRKENIKQECFVFGLDIGIASVGWAVVTANRIVDLGVRRFNAAENENGKSLNLERRMARLSRNRFLHRSDRLARLSQAMEIEGLISGSDFFKKQPKFSESTWKLRVAGLDRLLTSTELARVIYHLCKHRGFHWASKADAVNAKGESGKIKKSLTHTQFLMSDRGYKTAAEMILAEFPTAQRNKRGNYDKAISRIILDNELAKLFEEQRHFGSEYANTSLELLIRGNGDQKSGIFWDQKPALTGVNLLQMIGKCTFEKTEYRAPKASFTAERHVWLTKLNNLRIIVNGESRPLSEPERQAVFLLPYQSGEKFTYKTFRSAAIKTGLFPDSFCFGDKYPENQTLIKLSAWHELRTVMNRLDLGDVWQQISVAALDGQPETLDQIAWILSVYKEDDEAKFELEKLNLPKSIQTIDALLNIRFDKFHALSLKALRNIVPLMERGLRYDQAVASIPQYGHQNQQTTLENSKNKYLSPFYSGCDKNGKMLFKENIDVPRNPVVLRALNQARKVVNALIKTYGSPVAVNIEMARDLSRPFDERKDVEKLQKEYKKRNDEAREEFERLFFRKPNGKDFEKWMLYLEQGGQCVYSQTPLAPTGDLNEIFLDGCTQIDHAIPYSRSFDNNKNNKVLVLTRENQNKGNRTPYEYLTSFAGGEDGDRWRSFAAWVNQNKSYRMAKRNRLLKKDYGEKESVGFRDRNLYDTRYICRFFKNYVEENLLLASRDDGEVNKRCVVVNGQLTSFLRARWGLTKNRSESDRHHALDAVVVAVCSHSMVKALSDYSRRKEIQFLRNGIPDPETGEIISQLAHDHLSRHFPEPWSQFRHELDARLKTDDLTALREDMACLGSYSDLDLQNLRTVFVSCAPQRLNTGSAHTDTILAKPRIGHNLRVKDKTDNSIRLAVKSELNNLSVKKIYVFETTSFGKKYSLDQYCLDKIVGDKRDTRMIEALKLWIIERGDDPKKPGTTAFPKKPCKEDPKNGPFTGPEIKSIKINNGVTTSIEVRNGLVGNDKMIRVDVFTKAGKFHLVPVYVHHQSTGLPNRAIVHSKDESEWTLIDDNFDFLFSIYQNDLIKITLKNEVRFGYYSGCDRTTGAINLWVHDRAKSVGKDGLIRGIGVKTAVGFTKFNVDLLGHIYTAPPEVRHGLA